MGPTWGAGFTPWRNCDARLKIAFMNTTPTINVTAAGAIVGVATARLLLQHALVVEEQKRNGENPDQARKRAVNDLTGASIHLPGNVPVEQDSGTSTTTPAAGGAPRDIVIKE